MKIWRSILTILAAFAMITTVLLPDALAKPLSEENIYKTQRESEENSHITQVIVRVKPGNVQVTSAIKSIGGKVKKEWQFINALLVEISESKLNQLAVLPGVLGVTRDHEAVELNSSDSNTKIDGKKLVNAYHAAVKVEKVWNKGITGKGVTVAVVDSGVYNKTDSDFGNRLIKDLRVTVEGDDNTATFKDNDKGDEFGHGTHIAGVIGGDGANSEQKYVGIAPGVNLISLRFMDGKGAGKESDIVSALGWIYANHKTNNIRVVNISSTVNVQQSYKESAVAAAVEVLWKEGIVVVVSAGNKGREECSTCYAPANSPYVITVGAIDDNGTKKSDDDYLKSWSSIGKTKDGHSKPEVVAPGSQIISYMPEGNLREQAPENIVNDDYFKMGGTSVAAPIVSGIVALMLETHPEWTPDQVKWVLQNTSHSYGMKDLDEKKDKQGKQHVQQENGNPHVPGMVTADKAVFYKKVPLSANQGLESHPFINAANTENVYESSMSWANMSWANMSWANMSWANNAIDK
jgi:serine protease AprX